MLPDEEIDAFRSAVDEATALASVGQLAGGYDLLVKGLRAAKRDLLAGSPWAAELIRRYTLAGDQYMARYGVRLP
jgi:hypothetical protein